MPAIPPSLKQRLVALEKRVLRACAQGVVAYAKTILSLCLLISVAASIYTAQHLELVTGRNDLISTEKRYLQLDEEYSEEFIGLDQVVVVVEPQDIPQGKAFVTRLGERLAQEREHIAEIFYRVNVSSLEGKKLLYLSPENLRDLRRSLEDSQEIIHELLANPGLNTLFEAINTQVSSAVVSHLVEDLLGLGTATDEESGEFSDSQLSFLNALLQESARALNGKDYRYRSPWAEFFGGTGQLDDEGFLIAENRKYMFLMVEAKEDAAAGFNDLQDSMAAIRRAITDLKVEFPGLDAGVTGTKALGNDEMLSAQHDTAVATVVSLSGIALLYLLFFRRIRHPFCIISALMIGLSWTLGFVTLSVGHLTIITVFIAPMLLGLADDFGVHFMTRYEEERGKGKDQAEAITIVFEQTVPSIIAGALTTALAFFSVMLADFRGVQELGIISGGGILLSVLAVLTFLPALIVGMDSFWPWRVSVSSIENIKSNQQVILDASVAQPRVLRTTFSGLGKYVEQKRSVLFGIAGLGTAAGLLALPWVSFDYNLLNLQAHGTESVEWEKRIIENSERSSWNALATAPTPEAARQKAQAFAALPSVETVESVAALIPDGQQERLPLLAAIRPLLSTLPPLRNAPRAVEVRQLERTLDKLRLKIRTQENGGETILHEARQHLLAVFETLRTLPVHTAQQSLTLFQNALFLDFQDKWSLLSQNLSPVGPITFADVPPQLRSRFVSSDGQRFLLQIYPKENIWEREPLTEFIRQLRTVDPDVTGSPIIGYESIGAMKDGYVEAAWYAFLAILVVTFLALRRVGDALLAVLPLGLGMIWTAGLMWLGGVQFNLANMVAAPLIIGIGVENGIHLVHRFREGSDGSVANLIAGSTGQAVVLFSLTTMVGFGSLMVAQYYGIFSMGLLLTLAVGSVLIASIVVLPLLLYRPERIGQESDAVAPELSVQDSAQGDLS